MILTLDFDTKAITLKGKVDVEILRETLEKLGEGWSVSAGDVGIVREPYPVYPDTFPWWHPTVFTGGDNTAPGCTCYLTPGASCSRRDCSGTYTICGTTSNN